MPDVLSVAAEVLDAVGALVVTKEEDGWRVGAVHGLAGVEVGEFHSDESAPTLAFVYRMREPSFVGDVDTAATVGREQGERMGHRSFITYPVLYRDQVVAAVSFMHEGRAYAQSTRSVRSSLASRT